MRRVKWDVLFAWVLIFFVTYVIWSNIFKWIF